MNRRLYILISAAALLAVIHSTASAQLSGIRDRAYSYVGLGPNFYQNDDNSLFNYLGYHGEVGIGANFFDDMGIRLGAMAMHGHNIKDYKSNYLLAHGEFTYNLSNLIYGYNSARKSSWLGFAGLGIIQRIENYQQCRDNEVLALIGINYTYRLASEIYLLTQLQSTIFFSQFDFNEKTSAKFYATIGIEHKFHDSSYRNGMLSGEHTSLENWFASINGGIDKLSYAGMTKNDSVNFIQPAIDLNIGKYLSPVVAMRLGLQGIKSATAVTDFTFISTHIDLMFCVNNMKYPQTERPFSILIYLGGGIISRLDENLTNPSADAGVLARFRLSSRSDIMVDMRYTAIPVNFIPEQQMQGRFIAGMMTGMVGYSYNITLGRYR